MKISVTNTELEILKEAISSEKSDFVLNIQGVSNDKYLVIDDEQADELRDLCGDYLSVVGFDAEYQPNQKGLLLEGLIDKLFIDG